MLGKNRGDGLSLFSKLFLLGVALSLTVSLAAWAQNAEPEETPAATPIVEAASTETAAGVATDASDEASDGVFVDAPVEPSAAMPTDALESMLEATATFFNDTVSEPINTVCPFKGEIDYEDGAISCGFIEVPENRSDPESRTIRLLYARLAATVTLEEEVDSEGSGATDDEEELVYRDDPVIYLTGGPGVGLRPYVERFLEHDLIQTRDLYILQQRGIDESGDFCPFFSQLRPELVRATNALEGQLEQAERLTACLSSAAARGVDVSAYNTVENAHDVRALRRALSYDSWNVWGISYGSHLGQMLVNVDEAGIRALVLDAIVPNDLVDLMRLGRWIERDMGLLFDRCGETGGRHCDGLEERLLAAAQMPFMRVEALDLERLPAGETYLPPVLPAYLVFSMMYEQDEHPAMPAVMDGALRLFEQDRSDLLAITTAMNGFGGRTSAGMSAAVRCNDGYTAMAAAVAEEDLAEHNRFLSSFATVEGYEAMARACEAAGAPMRADRTDYQLVETDLPTLIINGAWDPITPPPLAERIAPGFTNSRYVEVPFAGHGPTRSMSACSGDVLTAFFDDPQQDLAALDMTCFEDGVDAPTFENFLITTGHLQIAARVLGDEADQLYAPGAIALFSVVTLLGSLVLIPAGFLARITSGRRARDLATGDGLTRALAFVAAATTAGGLALIGAAAARTFEMSETSLIVGLAEPASTGAWVILLGGVVAALLILRTVLIRASTPLRTGTMLGFLMIGGAGVSLAVLAALFDLLPF